MKKLTIVKMGGQIIDDQEKLDSVLKQFSKIDHPKILVHGGGKLASEVSNQMGVATKMIEGRRVTDSDSLKIVQMVYAGLINTNIVADLQAQNCNALGLNGSDGNSILAVRRPVKKVDYGYVGDITKVNPSFLKHLLEMGTVPVFCALTHDGVGQILNTNADTITAELGIALLKENYFKVDLVYCFEKKGVLAEIENDNSLIPFIDKEGYTELQKKRVITDGMIPKIDNAFDALEQGVKNVFIIKYNQLDQIEKDNNPGTRISL